MLGKSGKTRFEWYFKKSSVQFYVFRIVTSHSETVRLLEKVRGFKLFYLSNRQNERFFVQQDSSALGPRPTCYSPQMMFAKVMFSQVSFCPQWVGESWSLSWGVSVRETPLHRDPQTETPLYRNPSGQRPPGQIPPWTETPLGQRPPWTETPLDRDPPPRTETLLPGQIPPYGNGRTVRILLECILVVDIFLIWNLLSVPTSSGCIAFSSWGQFPYFGCTIFLWQQL